MDTDREKEMKNMEQILENFSKEYDLAKTVVTSLLPDGFSLFLKNKIETHKKSNGSLNYLYFLEYLNEIINNKNILHTDNAFAGNAVYKNTEYLKSVSVELFDSSEKLGNENIFSIHQWVQILAFMIEFGPCNIFIEGAKNKRTEEFFNKATALTASIYGSSREKKANLLYFHSSKEKHLKNLFQKIKDVEKEKHAVIIRDFSDKRVLGEEHIEYGSHKYVFGNVVSDNPLCPIIIDFLDRNDLTFFSADYSLMQNGGIVNNDKDCFLSSSANWRWFTFNEKKGLNKVFYPITYKII